MADLRKEALAEALRVKGSETKRDRALCDFELVFDWYWKDSFTRKRLEGVAQAAQWCPGATPAQVAVLMWLVLYDCAELYGETVGANYIGKVEGLAVGADGGKDSRG